jgi:transcription-repair coupling factor (superfamily II helicase)
VHPESVLFAEKTSVRDLDDVIARVREREGPLRLTGLRGAAVAVVGARLVEAHPGRAVLFLAAHAKAADALLEDLRAALGEPPLDEGGRLRLFPRHDSLPYERFSPQPFVVAQRMDVLYRWLAHGPGTPEPAPVVVAPWTALAMRVPARETVRGRSVHLEVGQTTDRDALIQMLLGAGYGRVPLVEERGELAVRGGILDFFPPQRARPVRVELLGDDVESLREFDPASQRSQGRLGYVVAPPPRELVVDRSLVIERSERVRALAESEGVAPRAVDELLDALLRGHAPPGAEALAPLLQPRLEGVLDFLPRDALVVIDDDAAGRQRLLHYAEEALDHYDAAREAGRLVSSPAELLLAPDRIEEALGAQRPVFLERLEVADPCSAARYTVRAFGHDELRRELTRARTSDTALAPLVHQLERWVEERWRVVLATTSLSGAERLRTLLEEYGVRARTASDGRPVWRWSAPGRVEIRVAPVSEGFLLPIERLVLVTEEEIFGSRERRRARRMPCDGAAIEALGQLRAGHYLVHAEHGIGIYRGLVNLELRGVEGEFLRIEYDAGDRLFLPVHRLNLVQRYVGADGHVPRIDRLGGSTWEKAKRQVRQSLRDMAQELLALHAARELAPGYAFPPRDRHAEEFEATFPYEETPDQLAAIEDVLADLQRPKPMDRLICGDVGFGKTEIGVRAAFLVAMAGKQTAVLVPTTVLCDQHEATFRQRLAGYPIRIESLSRFRTPREATRVLEGLAAGTVDIVIGTHRMLQKTVRFRELGLLVVDEEHRFGVAHKERIKQLKKTVDVLTLTATPIPRTLQMAFAGLRDLSVINTPPEDRLSIRTRLCRFSESLIREAILREVQRGGQVFFVHNRVQTIGAIAELLERIVPEVKMLVAHGQMNSRKLEERMLRFFHGEAEVLLCTSIIESGLDVPRANTILIDRADTFGLAQLYQLRGRVGRSHHRAYAYLLVPGADALTSEAKQRLEAIQDLSELGSGFRLASMDLEIRGAGNLLGGEQSGSLAAVGYETYMQMLEETVDELRGRGQSVEIDPEIRLPIPARLPEDYVPDVSQRLVLYKRLASAPDEADLARIRDELLDRFGPLPPHAVHLLEVIRLKIQARGLGITAVDVVQGELALTAAETTRIDPQRLVNLLTQVGLGLRVTPDHKIFAPLPPNPEPQRLFEAAHSLLSRLAA